MDASRIIDQEFAALTDWRGDRLRALRQLIHQVAPQVIEEWKWMGSPVWSCDGILCVANAHKETVRVTFPKGAQLEDPAGVFNAELAGNARRAILWKEGDPLDVKGVKAVLAQAMALNRAKPAARKPDARARVTAPVRTSKARPTPPRPSAAKKKAPRSR